MIVAIDHRNPIKMIVISNVGGSKLLSDLRKKSKPVGSEKPGNLYPSVFKQNIKLKTGRSVGGIRLGLSLEGSHTIRVGSIWSNCEAPHSGPRVIYSTMAGDAHTCQGAAR